MKKIAIFAYAILLALMLCACAQNNTTTKVDATTPASSIEATTPAATKAVKTPMPTPFLPLAPPPEPIRNAFTTLDINGNTVTQELFKGAKVVLLNFWESWCAPCMAEMPDLQKLYEQYADSGLLVVGVFSDASTQADAVYVQQEMGITYPLLRNCNMFYPYVTDYIPNSVLLDGDGNPLSDESIGGSRSFEEWEAIVLPYLK